jgi:hypothetical protein
MKVNLRKSLDTNFEKITRSATENQLDELKNIPLYGKPQYEEVHMGDIMKHDYLKRSMEQRAQRKALYNEYVNQVKKQKLSHHYNDNRASKLRSQSCNTEQ